ncbi:MAG: hypothetical protein V4819_03010 [Verrucomicrobiota bacterium]
MKLLPCLPAVAMSVLLTVTLPAASSINSINKVDCSGDELRAPPATWDNSALVTFTPHAGATSSKLIISPGAVRKLIRAAAVKPLP